jgi:DNA invertase Pin-like site-specific DNA recombinase
LKKGVDIMVRCVAYARVSTDHEDQKNSIEEQKKQWIDLFKTDGYNPANVGMLYKKDGSKQKVNGIFADEGISATSYKRREAFKLMLEYAKKKAFDIIYVEDVSRFTRSVEDGARVIKDLRELGIAVYFRKENINTLDPLKEFEINLRMAIYQEESRVKSERLKWAVNRLQLKGGWNTPAPYGYDKVNNFLVINKQEAEVVKTMFNLFIDEGYGIGKIARYLNDRAIPTKKGKAWSQKQITEILDNQLYTGVQTTHTIVTVDINRNLKRKVDEDEQIVHYFDELSIVSKELFERVKRERQDRNEMFSYNSHHSSKHLLSSLIYCGHCGGNYKRKKRHSYRRADGSTKDIGYELTCAINDMYGKSRCGHRNMLIEEEIIEDIKAEIQRLKNNDMKGYFELYLLVKFDYQIGEDELNRLSESKRKVREQIELLASDYVEKIITDRELYKERAKALNAQLADIDRQISRIEQHDLEIENAKVKYEEFLKYVREVDVNKLTNTILKRLFKKIVVTERQGSNGESLKVIMYYYNFMGLSLEELLQKVAEKGYNVEIAGMKCEI